MPPKKSGTKVPVSGGTPAKKPPAPAPDIGVDMKAPREEFDDMFARSTTATIGRPATFAAMRRAAPPARRTNPDAVSAFRTRQANAAAATLATQTAVQAQELVAWNPARPAGGHQYRRRARKISDKPEIPQETQAA
jgi:hypothetical protein